MPGMQATGEADIGSFTVPVQPGQKCSQDVNLNGKNLDVVAHACHPSKWREA
jgi:hypothetical protein